MEIKVSPEIAPPIRNRELLKVGMDVDVEGGRTVLCKWGVEVGFETLVGERAVVDVREGNTVVAGIGVGDTGAGGISNFRSLPSNVITSRFWSGL